MARWLTLDELLALRLVGLPRSERRLRDRLQDLHVRCRARLATGTHAGRGRPVTEYDAEDFEVVTHADLLLKCGPLPSARANTPHNDNHGDNLGNNQDAPITLEVQYLTCTREASGSWTVNTAGAFGGKVTPVRTRLNPLILHADPQSRQRGRPPSLTPEMAQAIRAILYRANASGETLRKLVAQHLGVPAHTLPDKRSFQRWVVQVRSDFCLGFAAAQNPDGYRASAKPSFGSMTQAVAGLNAEWQIDTTPVDFHLLQDGSPGGRMPLFVLVDVWSGREFYYLSPSCSANGALTITRLAIKAWGKPQTIKFDRGSEYLNESYLSACRAVGIETHACPPGSPDRKPFVERAARRVQYGILEQIPGFAGHNVPEAQKLRAAQRKRNGRAVVEPEIEIAEFVQLLKGAQFDHNHIDVHSRTGQTPEARAASYIGSVEFVDARALDTLLIPVIGTRQLTKNGLRVDNTEYLSAELAAFIRPGGRTVQIRRDENDLGTVYVFGDDGRFLCEAYNPQLKNMDRQTLAKQARKIAAQTVRAQADQLRSDMRQIKPEDLARDYLKDRARDADKLIDFPGHRPADGGTPITQSVSGSIAAPQISLPPSGLHRSATIHKLPSAETAAARTMAQLDTALSRCLDICRRLNLGDDTIAPDDIAWAKLWLSRETSWTAIENAQHSALLGPDWSPPSVLKIKRKSA
jgi:putative transposase